MKIIKQPINCYNSINQPSTLMHAVVSLITLSVIMLGLLMPTAHAEEPYRFDRLWPKLTQPWHFTAPSDIAIAPDGLVYVADTNFHRIQVFSQEGDFIRSWGRKGSEKGEFDFPRGIAVSASGVVYVVDEGNHRIQVFNKSGVFQNEWGNKGSGDGEFNFPARDRNFNFSAGIAVSAVGEVYVVDEGNHRIQVFNTSGVFQDEWGNRGSGEGEFNFPAGIAVFDKKVYVVDRSNHRIQLFNTSGIFQDEWGRKGDGEGEFSSPNGIAVSSSGEVYVVDKGNHRIQVFNTSGAFKIEWGSQGTGDGEFHFPTGIVVSNSDEVYVTGSLKNNRIHIFDTNGKLKRKWESEGTGEGEFSSPNEIAVSSSGEVYVADSENHRIQVFDSNGNFQFEWGSKGTREGEFDFSAGIAVFDNEVYVVDRSNHRIQVFNTSGVFQREWGREGAGNGEFDFPRGIAVSTSGEVYVADRSNHRIQVFDTNGNYQRQWGSRGAGDKEFSFPKGIAISTSNEVYVTDTFNNRILVFDTNGKLQRHWGSEGLGNDEFSGPQDIAVSAFGEVYVTDSFKNPRIQIFDKDGLFIESIGSLGSSPGQVNIPLGIALNSEGALFLADTGNNRIQKFVRAQSTMQHPYKAIILAGGGPPTDDYSNLIWNETQKLTNRASQALRTQGFQKDEVKFLTAGNTQSDLDGNGKFDDFETASLASLRLAITQWAVDADNVVIYLIDHGGPGIFAINDKETLKEAELTAWVNILNEKIPGKVTLIIEACKSASFLKPLANKNKRINLISSTNADQPNTVSNRGFNSFSFFFWSAINFGNDLQIAYGEGKQGITRPRQKGEKEDPQDPHLDSNGDQQFNTIDDFTTLANFCLGNCTNYSATPPTIVNPSASTELNGPIKATLSMQVESKEPILRAWVVIKRPDFKHPNSNEPISDLPEFELECDDNKRCTTSHDKFNVNGDYVITYNVLDKKLQQAPPKPIILTQTQGIPTNECTLDVDGNSRLDTLTDGLLLIRYMLGIKGEKLIVGAKANDCVKCSAEELEPNLELCRTASTSDIDGNGKVDALTDGLLMIRYLFGTRGQPLIEGAVAPDCTRCGVVDIEGYLQQLMVL